MTTNPYYSDDTLTLLLGDARKVLSTLDDQSVNCVVTSPPYYGLRDYEGNPDQIGLEQTPAEYVAALAAVFDEVRRVLADDGTLWLNLGDSYDRAKNLLGIPWRVAFALQDAGWYLRNAIVWHKPNAMPESVRDRLSNRYELLFLLAKSKQYWFDIDPIREPYSENKPWGVQTSNKAGEATARLRGAHPDQHQTGLRGPRSENPLGRAPGNLWTFPAGKLVGSHFAAFPIELPRRCIAAGCRPGGTVLDPFSGAGTTALAAQQLGHPAIGIDVNAKYHDIALKRMSDAPLPFGGVA